MNLLHQSSKARVRMLLIALTAASLHACGGGGSGPVSNANNSAVAADISNITSGTVNGFGSVMADGVEIEDAGARVQREAYDGSFIKDVLQMGHRVRVAYDDRNNASKITIDAAVTGTVSNIEASSLTVAGQKVTVNTDRTNTALPFTVFAGGYTDLGSVRNGDLVEVHGLPVYDEATKSYTVQATRVQKRSDITKAKISGKITDYAGTASGATFKLNGLSVAINSTTAIRPAGSTLANDLQITAWGNATFTGGVFSPSHIRVDRHQDSGNNASRAQLSGLVSGYTAGGNTLVVGTTTVNLDAQTRIIDGRNGPGSLSNSAYVLVAGRVGADGSITADRIQVRTRDAADALAQIKLIGTISDYVSDSSFVVRGVPVDAGDAALVRNNCPTSLANDLVVRITARQQAGTNVVLASRIECSPGTIAYLIRGAEGSASGTNLTAKTFVLTDEDTRAKTVLWNDNTTFVGISEPTGTTTLDGMKLRVEGYLNDAGVLVARVIRIDSDDDSVKRLDDHDFRMPKRLGGMPGGPAPLGWDAYRARR